MAVIELGMADDPFETLGLSPRFDLTADEVERAYLARAALCHPDLVSGNAEQAADAARLSSGLNGARAALADPESRANALLARLGGAAQGSKDLPDGFLMEIMETRMEVESAAESGDAAELARWRAWAAEERRGYIERLGVMFAALGASGDAGALRAIREQLNAWRYIERMLEQIER